MEAFRASRSSNHQQRNSSPIVGCLGRTTMATSWSKRVVCVLALVLLCVSFDAWVKQLYASKSIDTLFENFSSEDSPERDDDDSVPDNFYFLGGRPIWFDVTLEGRWTKFVQNLERVFSPSRWRRYGRGSISHHDHVGPDIFLLERKELFARQHEEDALSKSWPANEAARRPWEEIYRPTFCYVVTKIDGIHSWIGNVLQFHVWSRTSWMMHKTDYESITAAISLNDPVLQQGQTRETKLFQVVWKPNMNLTTLTTLHGSESLKPVIRPYQFNYCTGRWPTREICVA